MASGPAGRTGVGTPLPSPGFFGEGMGRFSAARFLSRLSGLSVGIVVSVAPPHDIGAGRRRFQSARGARCRIRSAPNVVSLGGEDEDIAMDIYRAVILAAAFARMEWDDEEEGPVDRRPAGTSMATGTSLEWGEDGRFPDGDEAAEARRGQGEDRGSERHFALLRAR
jgi:hypothetical protein